jgi:hypothetical protein
MECLSDQKLIEYIDKGLPSVELSLIRDHLVVCPQCQARHKKYSQIENYLNEPVYDEPPAEIEKYVLRRIYSRIPTYSSVLTLIAASFVFLVSWIYIYFDFANNSMVRALQLTTDNTTSWVGSVIKVISTVFTAVYGGFQAVNKFIAIVFDVHLGVEIIGLSVLILSLLFFYGFYRWFFKRKERQKA